MTCWSDSAQSSSGTSALVALKKTRLHSSWSLFPVIDLEQEIQSNSDPTSTPSRVWWIQEERFVSEIQFGFMTSKSSVDQLCRLINTLTRKKAAFLVSIDLKGTVIEFTTSSSILAYLAAFLGMPTEWHWYIFYLRFGRQCKVRMSSAWRPLRIGCLKLCHQLLSYSTCTSIRPRIN